MTDNCARLMSPNAFLLPQLKELLAHGAAIQGMRDQDNKKAAQVTPDTSPQKGDKPGQDKAATDKGLKESNGEQARTSPASKQKLGVSEAAPPAKRSKVRLLGMDKDSLVWKHFTLTIDPISLLNITVDCQGTGKLFRTRRSKGQGS